MITFLTVVHVATVILLVITVLLQSGKGADISASFGGSSQTVFGSSGGVNFFQKLTYALAAVFMMTSLTLTLLPGRLKKSVFEGYTPPPVTTPVGSDAAKTTAPATTNNAASNSGNSTAPAGTTAAPAAKSTAPAAPTHP
jgi:preprotein translocase subunit SecG